MEILENGRNYIIAKHEEIFEFWSYKAKIRRD